MTTGISLQNNLQTQSDQLLSERFSEHDMIKSPVHFPYHLMYFPWEQALYDPLLTPARCKIIKNVSVIDVCKCMHCIL